MQSKPFKKLDNSFSEKKIFLRKMKIDDLPSFASWATDPEVTKSLTWDAYTSVEEMKLFLQEVAEPHPWFMAIVYEGKVIGSITISLNKGSGACRGELGYVLSREYWGMGIGTLAVKIAIERGFNELNINRIECFVDPLNIASIKVCEKASMVREGLLKNFIIHKGRISDRYIYAVYK